METVVRIIDDYRETPSLWNKHHADYRDAGVRQREWQRLGRKHNMSEAKIEKKVHNLRAQFTRELKILRESKKNNTPLKKRIWFGYHRLLFLVPDEKERNTLGTYVEPWSDDSCEKDSDLDTLTHTEPTEPLTSDPDKGTVSDDFELNFDDIIATNVVNASSLIPLDVPANSPQPTEGSAVSPDAFTRSNPADGCQSVRSVATKRAATESYGQGTGSGKRMKEPVPRWDEYDAYGEYVGHKLRNSNKSRVEIAVAQRDIEDVFVRLEVGAYAVPEAQGKRSALLAPRQL